MKLKLLTAGCHRRQTSFEMPTQGLEFMRGSATRDLGTPIAPGPMVMPKLIASLGSVRISSCDIDSTASVDKTLVRRRGWLEPVLLTDTRGAILVPSIVMGALLVGALYYVASVGDAIIFRTQLQDAADATAFKSTVWHARGMNMIVVLNVIMSVALGIFALLRMVEVIFLILCLIPPLFPICMPIFRTLANDVERIVFRGVNTALVVSHALEAGVSVMVPWVAFATAKSTPTAAETIWPVSLSLVPPLKVPPSVAKKLPLNAARPRLPETGPSALPVQQDQFGTLCAKGFTIIPKQLAAWTESIPVFGSDLKKAQDAILNDVARKVFGLGDGIFCQPIAGIVASLINMVGEKVCAVGDSQREATEAEAETRTGETGSSGSSGSSGGSSGSSDPNSRGRTPGGGGSCLSFLESTLGEFADKNRFEVSAAKVWDPAANGSPLTHVWSYAQAPARMWETDRKGVAMAARGKEPNIGEIKGASALGEFYFDCAAGWEHACEWDAMWAPAWTARMRRYRPPLRELADVGLGAVDVGLDELKRPLEEIIGEKAGEAFHAATGLPAEGPVAGLVTAFMKGSLMSDIYNENIQTNIAQGLERSGINEILNPANHANRDQVH